MKVVRRGLARAVGPALATRLARDGRKRYCLTLLGFVLSVSACGSGTDARPEGSHPSGAAALERDLYLVSGSQARFTCLVRPHPSFSPEAAERPLFRQRRQPSGQLLPINAGCVARSYSEAELVKSTADGDPVAAMALGYIRLSRSGGDCVPDLRTAELLAGAGHTPAPNESNQGSELRVRVPEALAVAASINLRCGRPFIAEELATAAERGGYFYVTPSE